MKKKLTALLLSILLIVSAIPGGAVYAGGEDDGWTELREETELTEIPADADLLIADELPESAEKTVSEGTEALPAELPEVTEQTVEGTAPVAGEVPETAELTPIAAGDSSVEKVIDLTEVTPETKAEPQLKAAAADFDAAAAYEYLMTLGEEEAEAYVFGLTAEEKAALEAYIAANTEQKSVMTEIPATVEFTDAGMLMTPVEIEVEDTRVLMMDSGTSSSEPVRKTSDGVETSKTVTANNDGSYTITLESYVTGQTVTTELSIPVDIVLVLDQSGSMTDRFGNTTRQAALKTAVNNFIDSVAEKYNANTADHRISIVTFDSEVKTLKGWTPVDSSPNGKSALKSSISGLPGDPDGATRVDYGMSRAETLLGDGYSYNGNNTTRQKVVIVFTDGVPTTASDFSTSVATSAIQSSKSLKDGGVTVYSIGIFNGANPEQLYGSSGFNHNSDGTVGSYWGRQFITLVGAWLLGDVYDWDVPAGNRFLNYLSSNYGSATSIGLKSKREDSLGDHKRGWEITTNYQADKKNYYLTASDPSGLNSIFQTISQQINTPTIQLGSSTVVKDVVSPYFTVPANTSAVSIKLADYNGSTFGTPYNSGLTAEVSGQNITVSGFDYSTNCVIAGQNGGKKLIIEFTVSPKDGFLGGNNVPTNGADSGVYVGNDVVENFEIPKTDVPIPSFTVTAADKNVYLNGSLTAAQLTDGLMIKVGTNDAVAYSTWKSGLQDWQDAYVTVPTAPGLTTTSAYTPESVLKADTTYTATLTISPKEAKVGGVQAQSASDDANIYVFKPVLKFQDSTGEYGEDLTTYDYETINYISSSLAWKHGTTSSTDTGVVIIGDAPTLTRTYTADAATLTANVSNVSVTVKIGTEDVTSYCTFEWQACPDCTDFNCTAAPENAQFRIHLISTSMTIEKTGMKAGESAIFTITDSNGFSLTVTLKGNGGSLTITGLHPGQSYTVTESSSWSWKYETVNAQTKTLVNDPDSNVFTFTNVPKDINWLSGETNAHNVFWKKTVEVPS